MRPWVKFTFIGLLLIVSLCGTIYAARATIGAVHSLSVQQTLNRTRDVRTVRSWMTIPYIAHTYRVPANYLYTSLGIKSKDKHINHVTLHTIATNSRRPDNEIVHRVQKAILTYRQQPEPSIRSAPASRHAKQSGRITM